MVRARATGSRHHDLDPAADPRRRAQNRRTQAAALPHPSRRRTDHPPRPPQHPAPARRLALGRSDPQSVQAPRRPARLRLTVQPGIHPRATSARLSPLAAAPKPSQTTPTSAQYTPGKPSDPAPPDDPSELSRKPAANHLDDESRLAGLRVSPCSRIAYRNTPCATVR